MASTQKTHEVKRYYTGSYHPPQLLHTVRSKVEEDVFSDLRSRGVSYEYESIKLEYIDPKVHKYTPDIVFPNGIVVEIKDQISSEDRTKMLLVKKQNPSIDIRFCLKSPKRKLSKASDTTYSMWCEKHGFPWCHKTIPNEWLT